MTEVAVNTYYRTNSAMRPARSLNVCWSASSLIGVFMPDNLLDLPAQRWALQHALSIYRILVHHVAIPAAIKCALPSFVLSGLLGFSGSVSCSRRR